jgi:hypothetical protein
MDFLFKLKMEDGCFLLVVSREYLSEWAESQPQKQGTSDNVGKFCYKDIICWFGTLESMVVASSTENKKCTNLLLRLYNIRKIIVTV